MDHILGKHCRIFSGLILSACLLFSLPLYSQDEDAYSWRTGADFYSSFVWRGSKFGDGPAVQPVIEFNKGRFTAGAWGSFDFRDYQEVDLYVSYDLPAGFKIGITDYYLPGMRYFDYSVLSGSHAFEINLKYLAGNISLDANYILNEAGGIGSLGNDLYFQAGYSFNYFRLFAGAGNGWHTHETGTRVNNFNVCNIGLETSKTIEITERFSIPVTGQLIFNPAKEQMFIVIGFTF